MARGFVSIVAIVLTSVPALVVAQQTPAAATTTPPAVTATTPPVVVVPPVPAATATPPSTSSTPSPSSTPEDAVSSGATPRATGGFAPLPNVELPEGMIIPKARPTTSANAPLLPPRPIPSAPPAKLTSAQIAQQIAPNFNVTRDYVRLTQCYGIADFMGAVTRIQATRPGATQQIIGVARSIAGLQDAMQPMVLAASTVRGEARFRADYDVIARNGQRELATSRTPNVTMQRRLATLDACRGDISRWRGGR
jgi:hypothetical protein